MHFVLPTCIFILLCRSITYNLGKKDESMEWFDIQKAEQV